MNKARQLLTIAWLAMASHALADNFIVGDFTIAPGETKTISVELNNTENEYIAFEFEMTLPEGVSILEDEDGYLQAELNSGRTTSNHELMASRMEDGSYHFVCYSLPNTKLKGTSGEILTIKVCAAENATPATGLEGKVFNQKLSDPQKNPVAFDDFTFLVNIGGGLRGDANGDGGVSLVDVLVTVDYYLGNNPEGFVFANAEMDGDGQISLVDMLAIVEIILNQETE